MLSNWVLGTDADRFQHRKALKYKKINVMTRFNADSLLLAPLLLFILSYSSAASATAVRCTEKQFKWSPILQLIFRYFDNIYLMFWGYFNSSLRDFKKKKILNEYVLNISIYFRYSILYFLYKILLYIYFQIFYQYCLNTPMHPLLNH